jgi:hypothetical protein
MISSALSSMLLPRATSLTRVLTDTSTPPIPVEDIKEVRRTLERELASLTASSGAHQRIRIDGYRIRRSVSNVDVVDRPFAWTPRTARRPIGLDAVRAHLADPRLAPARAVHDAIARLLRKAAHDGDPKTLEGWLARLSCGALAVVEAEAVVWATQLICSLEWPALHHPVVGADRSLAAPGTRGVVMRGRIDVEVIVHGSEQASTSDCSAGLFVMMTGRPLPSARLELGLSALTVALDRRRRAPGTVVGWWPEAGRALVMSIDRSVLRRTCHAVVESVHSMVHGAPRPLPRDLVENACQERIAS